MSDEFQELISTCETLLAKQDRLIAEFEAEGYDLTDALRLRSEIVHLLSNVQNATFSGFN